MRAALLIALLPSLCAAAVPADEPPAPAKDVAIRAEYTLKTPRPRDPVLGGSKEKVVVTVRITEGVKTVRGANCNPFSKDEPVGKHWQAACRHWGFADVRVDFDAVKKGTSSHC